MQTAASSKIFKIEWSDQFFPESIIDILTEKKLTVNSDNIKLGVTSMGQNIQSVKHYKASRMHHVPKVSETELLFNT